MIRCTTPTLTLQIPGRDLRECEIVVTLKSNYKTINKTNNDLTVEYSGDTTILYVQLTQADTIEMSAGNVNIQVNWLNSSGKREATCTSCIDVAENLYNRVMQNE